MGLLTDLMKEYPALSVARERLALVDEKYNGVVAENNRLKGNLVALHNENEHLKAKLAAVVKQESPALVEIEINILKLVGSGQGVDLEIAAIARQLNLPVPKTEYYVQRLVDGDYLSFPMIIGQRPRYGLEHKGREFLVINDLI